jgi:hypothetical protein
MRDLDRDLGARQAIEDADRGLDRDPVAGPEESVRCRCDGSAHGDGHVASGHFGHVAEDGGRARDRASGEIALRA